jgi:hypothetical protein
MRLMKSLTISRRVDRRFGNQHAAGIKLYAMGGKTFDLVGTISDLLRRIEEGRKHIKETQNVRDDFWRICAKRDEAHRLFQELQIAMVSLDEPAKSEAKAEFDLRVSEHRKLSDESSRQWVEYNETLEFILPFSRDILLLAERLPLKPEWDAYRQAIRDLDVMAEGAWWEPPSNPALQTLEMRLREMLDLAAGTQPADAPRSQASRRDRGPNLKISGQRIELEDQLRSELATVDLELRQSTSLSELRRKFPEFQIWRLLSVPEQESLLNEPFKPKAYARRLVLRRFGITSEDTIKKDRKKLRAAANKRPVA